MTRNLIAKLCCTFLITVSTSSAQTTTDLFARSIDVSGVKITTGNITGSITTTVENSGAPFNSAVRIVVWEDVNSDLIHDSSEAILGSLVLNLPISNGARETVAISLNGTVTGPQPLLAAKVDYDSAIAEADETNNISLARPSFGLPIYLPENAAYRYINATAATTVANVPDNWFLTDFDDTAWYQGNGPFSNGFVSNAENASGPMTPDSPGYPSNTKWDVLTRPYLRTKFYLPSARSLTVWLAVDNGIEGIFLNGVQATAAINAEGLARRWEHVFDIPAAYTKAGDNTLALQLEDHGAYTGFALVITEDDPAENPVFSINPPLPDLMVEQVTVSAATYPASVQISAEIRNSGGSLVPAGTEASLYRGDPAAGGTLLSTIASIGPLEHNAAATIMFNWSAPPAGQHALVVSLDDDGHGNGSAPERDESNNKGGVSARLGEGAFLSVNDLTVRFKDSSNDLRWNSIPEAKAYNLYRRSGDQSFSLLKSGITSTTFSDVGLQNGVTYYYMVRWVPQNGTESVDGATMTGTPTPPGSLGSNPPTILSFPVATVSAGSDYRYQLRVGDPDTGDRLRYSLISKPPGMSVNEAGIISWKTTAGDGGHHQIHIEVVDDLGHRAHQIFDLYVESASKNLPPVITSIPPLVRSAVGIAVSDPNQRIVDHPFAEEPRMPEGNVVLGGRPFSILPVGAENIWNGFNAEGENPRVLNQPIGMPAVTEAYTLINTYWGQPGPNSYLTLEFFGSAGAYHRKELIGGVDIRDYYNNVFTNTTSNPDVVEVFKSGPTRLDMQRHVLPAEFASQTLTSVRLTDTGDQERQRALFSGISVITDVAALSTGIEFSYQVTATDPENDLITYSLRDAPGGLTIDGSGLLKWTPGMTQTGAFSVTVVATDLAGNSATQEFMLQVVRPNLSPLITSLPFQYARVGAGYTYQVAATDPDGDVLAFALLAAPEGMAISLAGAITWTPQHSQQGTHQVSVRVSDPHGLAAIQNFTVTVQGENRPPVITSSPILTARPGGLYSYQVTVSDEDLPNDSTSFSLVAAPPGMMMGALGLVNWIVPALPAGSHVDVILEISDRAGAVARQVFTVTIDDNASDLPTVSLSSPTNGSAVAEDSAIIGTVTGPSLRLWRIEYQPAGAQNWITLSAGTTPVENGRLGTLPATLIANDFYHLRLYAETATGSVTTPEIEIEVNTHDLKFGDFTVTFEDMRIPGLGLPVGVQRTYDTKQPQDGGFGPHWALSFTGVYLRRDVNYNVFVTLPSGRRVKFKYDPTCVGIDVEGVCGFGVYNTRFTADSGTYDTLENTDCPQVLGGPPTPLCGGFQVWDPQNWILKTKEGYTYFITAAGGVRRMEDRNGNWIEISPDGITTNTGQNITFTRDGQGRITEIAEPSPSPGRLRYEYDSQGRLSRFIDLGGAETRYFYEQSSYPHLLTRIDDPLGRPITRNIFDASGRLSAQCDANGDPTTLAGCVRFNPDVTARTQTIYNARGFQTDLILDGRGNILSERRYIDNTNYLETVRTYDSNSNTLTERDPAGNVKSFTYDGRGNRLTSIDPGGRITRYTYNACDKVTTETDPAGNTTAYGYDTNCNLTDVKNALNHITRYGYNSRGQRTLFTDANGNTWTWAYDDRGFLTSLTDPFGKAQVFTFSSTGDLLSRIDRIGRRIDFQYEATHRVNKESWGDGRIIEYSYDSMGLPTVIKDRDATTRLSYDGTMRIQSIEELDASTARTSALRYRYDENGNVIEVIDSFGGSTLYSYDAIDRVSRVSQSGVGVNEKRLDFFYDQASTIVGISRFSDLAAAQSVGTSEYKYACGGCGHWLSSIRHSSPVGQVVQDITLQRDKVGNIIEMLDSDGRHQYTYDKVQRILSAAHDQSVIQPAEVYTYDLIGNRTSDNSVIAFTYSRNRLMEDSQWRYMYDEEGNLIQKRNRTTGESYEFTYDFRKRMVSESLRSAAGRELNRMEYSYDVFNRLATTRSLMVSDRFIYDGVNPILRVSESGVVTSRRLYGQEIDLVFSEDVAGKTRWLLGDHVNSVRDIIDVSGKSVGHYIYESFGRIVAGSGEKSDGFGFVSREQIGISGLLYFRSRYLDTRTGRFQQEDPAFPYEYDYAWNNPLLFVDPSGRGYIDYALLGIRIASAISISKLVYDAYSCQLIGTQGYESPGACTYRRTTNVFGFQVSRPYIALYYLMHRLEPHNYWLPTN